MYITGCYRHWTKYILNDIDCIYKKNKESHNTCMHQLYPENVKQIHHTLPVSIRCETWINSYYSNLT